MRFPVLSQIKPQAPHQAVHSHFNAHMCAIMLCTPLPQAADLKLDLEDAGGLTLNLALKPRLVRPVCCSAAFLQGAMWEGLQHTGTWFWEHTFADFVWCCFDKLWGSDVPL